MSKNKEQILALNQLEGEVKAQIYSTATEQQFITLLSFFREHLEEHERKEKEQVGLIVKALEGLDQLREG